MRLFKKNIQLIGSASSFESLSDAIKLRLYWADVNIKPSAYILVGCNVFDVYNLNGKVQGYIITEELKRTRWQLYKITEP